MKEQIGPRRSGNAAKVWKEPMVSIYVGVTMAILLASAVKIWLDHGSWGQQSPSGLRADGGIISCCLKSSPSMGNGHLLEEN